MAADGTRPRGAHAETVNCGCQSLPWMESWEVKHPGRKAFSEEEIARNPIHAELVNPPTQSSYLLSTTTGWGEGTMFPSRRIEADRGVFSAASEALTISTLSLAHPNCANENAVFHSGRKFSANDCHRPPTGFVSDLLMFALAWK